MTAARFRVAVVGVSGFSGAELARLLAAHPSFVLTGAVADRWKGESLAARLGLRGPAGRVVVAPMAAAEDVAGAAEVTLLATPADVSARLAPALLGRGVRVVDLSGAFRLRDPAAYPRWYGFEHPAPELLAEARYGLPEVPEAAGDAPPPDRARLVANPGCYATAAILALAPLVAAGLVADGGVFADGKSGVTGAGRKLEEHLLFTEVDENVSPYRVARHQHAPEIEQALARLAGRPVPVTFVPHLLPIRRGLIVTAFARLAPGAGAADAAEATRAFYARRAGEVDVVEPESVTIARVAHTPRALVGARSDGERGGAVAIGALDNLLKGAASQALQNLCAMVSTPYATTTPDPSETKESAT